MPGGDIEHNSDQIAKPVWAFVITLLLSVPNGALAEEGAPPLGPNTSTSNAPVDGSEPQRETPPSRAPESIPIINLSQIETEDLRLLYFAPSETYLTPYVGRAFENSLAFHREMFDWEPWESTTLLLKDFSDYGNAAARSSPNNALLFDIAPLSLTFETFSPGERFFTLTNHEVAHVATMDVWNSRDAFWRHAFFGKPMPVQEHPESILFSYLTTPRVTVPRWWLEGSAVFMETWMAGGFGRAQGGYDEMVFRSMVRDDAYFYSPLGLEAEGTAVDFQVGVNNYLYGTRFFSYVALVYSPEQVIEWLSRDEDSAAYYATHFREVFGVTLDDVWARWIEWEHTFQAANLERIRAFPETQTSPITPRALGSVSRSYVNPRTGGIVGAFRFPGTIAHVGVLEPGTGEIEHLSNIKGPMLYRVTSLAYDPNENLAWYTTDNYAYRDLMQIDLETGWRRMLIRDSRIGDLVFNQDDQSLWGLRHLNGLVTLVRLQAPYENWNQVYTFDFGRLAFDLDISVDGQYLSASIGEIDGTQTAQVFRIADLQRGQLNPIARFELPGSTPEGFVFSPDGRFLFGSSYYTGVSNIFRFEIATQEIEAVTNASTGFFRPIPQVDGSLIAYEYTGEGLRPVAIQPEVQVNLNSVRFLGTEVAQTHPVVQTWGAGSPNRVPFEERVISEGHYRPNQEMGLGTAYPVVEGYRGYAAFGYHAVFEDPLQFGQLSTTVSYSPEAGLEDQNWHVDVEYSLLAWSFRFRHNDADFYDLFGPTERSRAGNAFSMNYHRSMIYDPPRQLDLDIDAAYWTGLDTIPGVQTEAAQFDSLLSAGFSLHYSNTAKSLGGVDHESGIRWDLAGGVDHANGESYSNLRAGFDFGVPLTFDNSSAWLYTAVGAMGGGSDSPLSNFYIGAFGNNYVDDGEVKRYRDYDSFPGFELNEIDARQFARVVAEVNLPPVRVREVGLPILHLQSVRPAIFAGVLVAGDNFADAQDYRSLGGQLDFNFTAGHRLPMTFSIGYAEGYMNGERQGSEILLSLKIM